jgi:short-subunit dehydrogenase
MHRVLRVRSKGYVCKLAFDLNEDKFNQKKKYVFFCQEMMKVNYLGAVYCTKAVVDSMKKRRFGRIIFVSSQAGQIGIFGYTGYSASKFALRGLAECLQMELKPYNIFVTLSYPPDTGELRILLF